MAKVRIARSDDELGTIDESELESAIASGFRVVETSEVDAIKQRRDVQSTSGFVRGAAEATARGVSVGLSDVALRGLGADVGLMQARKEDIGSLGTGLEVAGAIAPALFTGGATAGVSGTARAVGVAKSLALPARGVAKLGLAAAERVGGGKLRQYAAQGAVEGFIQGAGAVASEDALGDRDLSAERLLVGGGKGAVLGGLLGGGVGAAGAGLSAVARGTQKVSQKVMRRMAGIGDDLSDPAIQSAIGKGGDLIERAQHAQLSTLGAGIDEHAALSYLNKLNRSKTGRQLMNEARTPSRFDNLTAGRLKTSFGGSNADEALGAWGKVFAKDARKAGVNSTAERVATLERRLERVTRGGGEAADAVKEARKLLRRGNKDGKMFERMSSGAKGAPPNPHRWLVKTLDDIEGAMVKREGTLGAQQIVDELRPLRELSEDTLMWGGKAPVAKTLYAAKDAERAAIANLPKKLQTAMTGEIDDVAAKALAKQPESVTAVLDARAKIADALEQAGEDVSKLRQGIDDTRKSLRYREELGEASDAWGMLKGLEEGERGQAIRTAIEGVGFVTGGGFGGLAGALGGRMFGEIVSGATRPAAILATMGRMRQAIDMVAGKEAGIIAGAERLAAGGAKVAREAARAGRGAALAGARATRTAAARRAGEPPRGRSERTQALNQIRRTVVKLAAQPNTIPDQMGAGMNEIRAVAPNVADAMVTTTALAVQFLASKVPPAYEPPFTGVSLVDPVALEKFGRYVDAVQDPLGAVKAIESGALALESAEVLRNVYPSIYGKIQEGLMEMVGKRAESGKPVSHMARVQMGLVLDLPLDPSLAPGFSQKLTGAMGPPPQPAPPGDVRASGDVESTRAETSMDRIEAGGERR